MQLSPIDVAIFNRKLTNIRGHGLHLKRNFDVRNQVPLLQNKPQAYNDTMSRLADAHAHQSFQYLSVTIEALTRTFHSVNFDQPTIFLLFIASTGSRFEQH